MKSSILYVVLAATLLTLACGAGDKAKLSQLRRGRRLSSSGKGKGKGNSLPQSDLDKHSSAELNRKQICVAAGLAKADGGFIVSAENAKAGGKAGGKAGKGGSSRRRKLSCGKAGKGKSKGRRDNEGCDKEADFHTMNLETTLSATGCNGYCACICKDGVLADAIITVDNLTMVRDGGKAGKAGKRGKNGSSSSGRRRLSTSDNGKGGKGRWSDAADLAQMAADLSKLADKVDDSCKCECNGPVVENKEPDEWDTEIIEILPTEPDGQASIILPPPTLAPTPSPVSSSPTQAPVSLPPTSAPVSSSPTQAPVSFSPTPTPTISHSGVPSWSPTPAPSSNPTKVSNHRDVIFFCT